MWLLFPLAVLPHSAAALPGQRVCLMKVSGAALEEQLPDERAAPLD